LVFYLHSTQQESKFFSDRGSCWYRIQIISCISIFF